MELSKEAFGLEEDNKFPIGIFDSGLGGLTVLKEMKRIMPNENYVYFGDTARVPYGAKSGEEIENCTRQDINFLNTFSPKILVAACGTVSSYLNGKNFDSSCEIIGVVKPTCSAAAAATKNGRVGIMCTEATLKSGSYEKCLLGINPGLIIYSQKCPKLVEIIESGIISEKDDTLCRALEEYLNFLLINNADTIILGCTHYPIIKKAIRKIAGKSVKLIDSGVETARFVKKYILSKKLNKTTSEKCYTKFYVSGDINKFSDTAKIFLNEKSDNNVFNVNIDEY